MTLQFLYFINSIKSHGKNELYSCKRGYLSVKRGPFWWISRGPTGHGPVDQSATDGTLHFFQCKFHVWQSINVIYCFTRLLFAFRMESSPLMRLSCITWCLSAAVQHSLALCCTKSSRPFKFDITFLFKQDHSYHQFVHLLEIISFSVFLQNAAKIWQYLLRNCSTPSFIRTGWT